MKKENKIKYKEININKINLNKNNLKLRIYYFDLLRIISAFSVILIHVSAEYYYNIKIENKKWKIAFYYNGISRFGVPMFFMISGALFLGRNISLNIIIFKYILRLSICLIIWSFIYAIYNIKLSRNNIEKIFLKFISGHFHFWYLYSTIQLYILTPFLKEIIKSNLLENLIKISFLFTFLIPNLDKLKIYLPRILSEISALFYSKLNFEKFKGNIFYFMLGYYLKKKKRIVSKNQNLIYFMGILGFFFTTIILYNLCFKKKEKLLLFFRPENLNILFYSISIFVLFKEKFNNLSLNIKIVSKKISNYTFGIYLIHPLIIEKILKNFYFSYFRLFIPLKTLIVFILSLLFSIVLKHLPFLGKYIM